jgi:hypothetical protein
MTIVSILVQAFCFGWIAGVTDNDYNHQFSIDKSSVGKPCKKFENRITECIKMKMTFFEQSYRA